jgi:hypothetical protein
LVLKGYLDAEALIDAAVNARFKFLESLHVLLRLRDDDTNFKLGVEMFLDGLSSLTTLRLHYYVYESLQTRVLERHGERLRQLVLLPHSALNRKMVAPTITHILNIRDSCPLLEDLTLVILRSKSNRSETRCYEALGTFASLIKLTLQLNGNAPDLPILDEEELTALAISRTHGDPLCHAHVRDALINSAVDEALARDIWDVISANKSGRPLAHLEISGRPAHLVGHPENPAIVRRVTHMTRSFRLTRNERDDSDQVEVVELQKRARERRDEEGRQGEARMVSMLEPAIEEKVGSIFEELWPPKPGSRDWRDDWSSWPLQRKTEQLS